MFLWGFHGAARSYGPPVRLELMQRDLPGWVFYVSEAGRLMELYMDECSGSSLGSCGFLGFWNWGGVPSLGCCLETLGLKTSCGLISPKT